MQARVGLEQRPQIAGVATSGPSHLVDAELHRDRQRAYEELHSGLLVLLEQLGEIEQLLASRRIHHPKLTADLLPELLLQQVLYEQDLAPIAQHIDQGAEPVHELHLPRTDCQGDPVQDGAIHGTAHRCRRADRYTPSPPAERARTRARSPAPRCRRRPCPDEAPSRWGGSGRAAAARLRTSAPWHLGVPPNNRSTDDGRPTGQDGLGYD